MKGDDSKYAKFTVPTLKAYLNARGQSVPDNKQELVASAIGCPDTPLPSLLHFRSSGKPGNDTKSLFTRPASPFPCKFCKQDSSGIYFASQFYVQLPLLYTAWTNAYSEIVPEVAAATFRDFLRERLRRTFTSAN